MMTRRPWLVWAACCAAALAMWTERPAKAQPEPMDPPAPESAPQKGRGKAPADTGPARPGSTAITAEQKAEILRDIDKVLDDRAFVPGVNLKELQPVLDKHRAAIDKAATFDEFARVMNTALRDFGISHLRLRTPVQAQRREQTSMVGVGISSRDGEGVLHVMDVVPNGPAAEAGISPGDVIVTINGKPPEAPGELSGDENSTVELRIRRPDGREQDITLTRKRFSTVRPETLTWVDDQTAVLRIYTFSTGYSRQNIEKLLGEAARARYLIVDLRSNGGGAVVSLRHLLSLLLPPETTVGTFVSKAAVARFRENGGDDSDVAAIAAAWDRKYRTAKGAVPPFQGKVAVLVNRGSASASEIAAAALRECGGAVVVGQKTAGAVLSSTFARLAHGFQLQYPSQDYVTIKGVRLEKHPVVPDAETPELRRGERDVTLERAVELLKSADRAPEIIPMKDAA